MSTVGFREAYASSIDVRLAADLEVKVASLAGLALLKIVACSDRRFERDAQDFGLIMRNYLDAGNSGRVYDVVGDCVDLLDEEFDYEMASARILGRDLSRILSEETRSVVESWLSEETNTQAQTFLTAMVRNQANYHGDSDIALKMLKSLSQGLSERLRL